MHVVESLDESERLPSTVDGEDSSVVRGWHTKSRGGKMGVGTSV